MKAMVLISAILMSAAAQADYQMTLYDKDGREINKCIKSYSFSNNLSSLNLVNKDIYSREESLTNKIYLNKPVYRRVLSIPSSAKSKVIVDTGVDLSYADRIVLLDNLVTDKGRFQFNSDYNQFWRDRDSQNLFYYHNSATGHNGIEVTIEYTKKVDASNSPKHTFRSYLHYVPSSSDTNEVETQDLENVGVRFLKGYSYDSSNDICSKI